MRPEVGPCTPQLAMCRKIMFVKNWKALITSRAATVHDFWGVGDAKAGTGVLLFLSKVCGRRLYR